MDRAADSDPSSIPLGAKKENKRKVPCHDTAKVEYNLFIKPTFTKKDYCDHIFRPRCCALFKPDFHTFEVPSSVQMIIQTFCEARKIRLKPDPRFKKNR